MLAFLSRRSRAIDPILDLRRKIVALRDLWREIQLSSLVGTEISRNFWSFVKRVKDPFYFEGKRGLSLETLQHKGPPQVCMRVFPSLHGVVAGSLGFF